MALFGNGNPKELLLFLRNFQMTLDASEKIASSAKIQYICTILCGDTLRQLETLSVEVVSTTISNLKRIFLGLGTYFFLLIRFHIKIIWCVVE